MEQIENKGKRLNRYVENYVVFDLETTGISVVHDQIIEISALKVKNHEIVKKFSTLVNPGRRIPAGATAVNGITDEMVKDAPELEEILPLFLEFAGEGILVGHNIHTFDLKFIRNGAMEFLQREISNSYIDTLYMARTCLPQLKHHRLSDVAEHFQISTEGAHRALNDCIMNQKCYEELGKLLKRDDSLTCPRCGGELFKRKGKFGEFFGCGNFPGCRYTRNV